MKIRTAQRVNQVEEYYFSKKLEQIRQMRAEGKDIINLGIGSPDLMPDQEVVDVLCQGAQRGDHHGYQSYRGIEELRKAISVWYENKFEVILDPRTEVLPLMGSKEGIMHISMTYCERGDEILVPNPGYPTYAAAGRLSGAQIRTYDLTEENQWLPDLEKLEEEDLSNVKIMWLNYPHMPSGAVASASFFDRLVDFAHRHDMLLCHDNPYAFILSDDPISLLSADGAKEVGIELNSFSKTYNMAGWRVGFLAGKGERIKEILRFKSNMASGMFKPLQLAATKALELNATWYSELNKTYTERRWYARSILDSLNCQFNHDQSGLFIWAKIPNASQDGISYSDEILERAHVFITPGNIFGSNGSQYLRLSLCNTTEVLEEAQVRVSEIYR